MAGSSGRSVTTFRRIAKAIPGPFRLTATRAAFSFSAWIKVGETYQSVSNDLLTGNVLKLIENRRHALNHHWCCVWRRRLSGTSIDRALKDFNFPPDDSLPFSLNVVFHVPGSIVGAPDYVGVRTAKFSKKQKKLMMQVAVPKEVIDAPNVRAFLFKSVRGAVVAAAPFLRKKDLEYPVERVLEIVRKEAAG